MKKKHLSHRQYLDYYNQNKDAEDFLGNVEKVFNVSREEFCKICLWKFRNAAFRSWDFFAQYCRACLYYTERRIAREKENKKVE